MSLSAALDRRSPTRHVRCAAVVEDLRGRVLGGFEIGDFLAEGSYGWVCRARQANPDREVVVKVLRHKAPDMARVNREAQSLARVSHPNAVKVLASGIE